MCIFNRFTTKNIISISGAFLAVLLYRYKSTKILSIIQTATNFKTLGLNNEFVFHSTVYSSQQLSNAPFPSFSFSPKIMIISSSSPTNQRSSSDEEVPLHPATTSFFYSPATRNLHP